MVVWLALLGAVHGAEKEWVFRGYFVLGDRSEFVSLQTATDAARWLPVGARIADHRIVRLDRTAGTVTLETPTGEERIVRLETATVGRVTLRPATPEERTRAEQQRVRLSPPADPRVAVPPPEVVRAGEIVDIFPAADQTPSAEGLDWDWIQSDGNPMRKTATLPSIAESAQWSKLSAAQRADLVELYRQCGWAITVFVRRNGLVGANIAPIPRPAVTGAKTGAAEPKK